MLATWTIGLAVGVLSSLLTLDFQTLNRQVELYKQSAEHDDLTGLYNQHVGDARTEGLEQEGRVYNVLALDIDHFKHVNDTYGHGNGDLVLQQFANILMEETRPHDITARIGGEEFMILVYDLTPSKVIKVANRIRERIANERFQLDGFPAITVTASIGIAHGKHDSHPAHERTGGRSPYIRRNSKGETGRFCSISSISRTLRRRTLQRKQRLNDISSEVLLDV